MRASLDPSGFRRQLALRGLTLEELAAASGVSRVTCSHALAGRSLNYLTIRSIARTLSTIPTMPGAEFIVGSQEKSAATSSPALAAVAEGVLDSLPAI